MNVQMECLKVIFKELVGKYNVNNDNSRDKTVKLSVKGKERVMQLMIVQIKQFGKFLVVLFSDWQEDTRVTALKGFEKKGKAFFKEKLDEIVTDRMNHRTRSRRARNSSAKAIKAINRNKSARKKNKSKKK